MTETREASLAFRGLAYGVLFSTPFWAVVGVVLWWLL